MDLLAFSRKINNDKKSNEINIMITTISDATYKGKIKLDFSLVEILVGGVKGVLCSKRVLLIHLKVMMCL